MRSVRYPSCYANATSEFDSFCDPTVGTIQLFRVSIVNERAEGGLKNLIDQQKSIMTRMVEANRKGELDDEFSVACTLGGGQILSGRSGVELSGEQPEVTPDILSTLESSGLILCEIKYQTKTCQSGTAKRPRVTETQSETSRSVRLLQERTKL